MARLHLLYRTNDHILELDELTDISDDTFVNDAAVSADVDVKDGANVATGVTLTYVPASDGRYRGLIEDTLALVVGEQYIVTVTAVKGATKGTWELKAQCVRRQE